MVFTKIDLSLVCFESSFIKFLSVHRYRHIYTSNGLTLHDIALSLANGQCVTTGYSDDMCAICGDAGDLLLCRECPQAFHPGV